MLTTSPGLGAGKGNPQQQPLTGQPLPLLPRVQAALLASLVLSPPSPGPSSHGGVDDIILSSNQSAKLPLPGIGHCSEGHTPSSPELCGLRQGSSPAVHPDKPMGVQGHRPASVVNVPTHRVGKLHRKKGRPDRATPEVHTSGLSQLQRLMGSTLPSWA
jgi:hypothetical protein